VTRPYSHSLSDDEKLYRSAAELADEVARDPLSRHRQFLIEEGILDEAGVHAIEKVVDKDIQLSADRALAAPVPKLESITNWVYSPDLDPESPAFDRQPASLKQGTEEAVKKAAVPKTMADLINHTLRDEMKRDERVLILAKTWPTARAKNI